MNEEYLDINGDIPITLKEWKDIVSKLIKEYGEDASIRFDAGYNNVSIMIVRSLHT